MTRRKKRGEQEQEPEQDQSAPVRLTPVDIQQKEFRLAFRGYNEQDVDNFLDHVTEEFARVHEENKRLREQLDEGPGAPTVPGQMVEDAQRRAEEIVRQAREQAARIVTSAEQPGASFGEGGPGEERYPGPGSPEELRSFLGREREFLQGLASLIQQHAEAVKQDAQRLREGGGAGETAASPEAGDEGEAPGGPASELDAIDARRDETAAWPPPTAEAAPMEERGPGLADVERAAATEWSEPQPEQPPAVTEPTGEPEPPAWRPQPAPQWPGEGAGAPRPASEAEPESPSQPAWREEDEAPAWENPFVTPPADASEEGGVLPRSSDDTPASGTGPAAVPEPEPAATPPAPGAPSLGAVEPAEAAGREDLEHERDREERSLRELFWGEDS